MSVAPSTVPCVVCRRELEVPPQGGAVTCPQCGEANRIAPGRPKQPAERPSCPVCGAPVSPDDPACDACGELLGSLAAVSDEGRDRSSATTLTALGLAAWRDYRSRGLLLGAAVFGAMLLWTMLFVSQTALGFGAAALAETFGARGIDGPIFAFLIAYTVAAIAALPVNAAVPLGLANLHLAVVRGTLPRGQGSGEGSRLAPLWRARGKGRILLCAALIALVGGGIGTAGVLLVDAVIGPLARFNGPVPRILLEIAIWAAAAIPALVLWTLFWPLPFLIVDRPDLHHVRPLIVCLQLPAGRWGGHVAISLLTAAVFVGSVFAWTFPLPFVGPYLGLLMAHAYDRADRDRPGEAAQPFDPEGSL